MIHRIRPKDLAADAAQLQAAGNQAVSLADLYYLQHIKKDESNEGVVEYKNPMIYRVVSYLRTVQKTRASSYL